MNIRYIHQLNPLTKPSEIRQNQGFLAVFCFVKRISGFLMKKIKSRGAQTTTSLVNTNFPLYPLNRSSSIRSFAAMPFSAMIPPSMLRFITVDTTLQAVFFSRDPSHDLHTFLYPSLLFQCAENSDTGNTLPQTLHFFVVSMIVSFMINTFFIIKTTANQKGSRKMFFLCNFQFAHSITRIHDASKKCLHLLVFP